MVQKVLLVDDEDDIREIAGMAIELDPSFEVRACASGVAAIEAVPEWQPDLILLDVMMPGMDGPTTLQSLQEIHGGGLPPVIFCTARAQAKDIESYRAMGATDVISKPFDPMSLAQTLKRYLS